MTPVEQIKERLSIVDVVSSYVRLEKAGMNFRARCPFHSERTPSFFVSPARGSFHCFGCNKGGDIFTFIEEIEGANFSEALKILADRAGVDLGGALNYEKGETAELYEILEEATKFFEKNLWSNSESNPPPNPLPYQGGGRGRVSPLDKGDLGGFSPLDYLHKRGLKDETIKNFRIGYASDSWFELLNHLKAKKFPDRLIEKAGMIILGDRGYHDRFRGRIMFPISNSQGRIVGFSGRIFEGQTLAAKHGGSGPPLAKYVNSPETVLYNKSKILFGYDKARRAVMQKNACIVVEGQMDLIISHQEGFDNTVAVSGTALTPYHLELIKRFTDILILAFDADEAGFKASERSVRAALEKGMDVRIAKLPKGLDPADYILKDKVGWEKSLAKASHIVDFYLDFLQSERMEARELSKQITKKVLPYIAEISSKLDQAHFIKKVADLLGVEEQPVREEVAKILTPPHPHQASPLVRGRKEEGVDEKSFIFQLEMSQPGEGKLEATAQELRNNLEKKTLEDKLKNLLRDLKRQEALKNEVEVRKILKECQFISKKINEIKEKK